MQSYFKVRYFKKLFIFLFYFLFFLTLSSNIQNQISNIQKYYMFNNILEYFWNIRSLYIYIIFALILFLFFKEIKKIDLSLKINIIFYLFLVYIFFSFLGINFSCRYVESDFLINKYLCTNNYSNNYLFSFHFIFSQLTLVLFLFLCNNYDIKEKEKNYLILIFYSIIFFILLIIINLIIFSDISYGSTDINLGFGHTVNINSNGAGRYFLLFSMLISAQFFFNNFRNKTFIFLLLLIVTFANFYLIMLEGKFNIIFLLLSFAFFIFFSKKKINYKLLFIAFAFLFPVILQHYYIDIKKKNIIKNCNSKYSDNELINECNEVENFVLESNSYRILNFSINKGKEIGGENELLIKDEIYSLKRFDDKLADITDEEWNNIYLNGRLNKYNFFINNFYSRQLYFGGGAEYDRFLVLARAEYNEKKYKLKKGHISSQVSSDSANGLIYALITAGLIGAAVYLIIFLYFFYISFFFLFQKKNLINNDPLLVYLILALGYLLGRSIVENGFINWGVDFIIFICFYSILYKKFISKKS